MKLSIVIPTMNRGADLRKALASLEQQTRVPDEVIVVDQSRDDATKTIVSAVDERGPLKGRMLYFKQQTPSSVLARNKGIDVASGDYVSFIDDDVEFLPEYFERIIAAFESDARIGGVGGSVLNSTISGFKWRCIQVLSSIFLLNFWNARMTPSGFGYPIYHRPIQKPTFVEMLHGCNMTFRAQAIVEQHFDDWFQGYSFREDVDFSYRVSRDWKILMIPSAQLLHHESGLNRMPAVELKRMELQNCAYVWRKHKQRGGFSRFLFRYSICGLVFISWLGALRGDSVKRAQFTTAYQAARDLNIV